VIPGVLFANEHWLVINKPTQLSTHGAFEGDLGLAEWVQLHLREQVFVCSRLDKGTSGVLVFARTAGASGAAQRIHEKELSEKTYIFVTQAKRAQQLPKSWTESSEIDGKSAHTEFVFVQEVGDFTFYEARIRRGRTHQIRIHASRCCVPILGDCEYGGADFPRLMLHCRKSRWPVDLKEKDTTFVDLHAPLPASFAALQHEDNEDVLALCVANDRRGDLLFASGSCFRVVHRKEVQLGNAKDDFSVDLYQDIETQKIYLSVLWYGEPFLEKNSVWARWSTIWKTLKAQWKACGVVLRQMNLDAHKRGLVNGVITEGEAPPEEFWIEENGLKYVCTLTKRPHVGLFLDQRDNRARVLQTSEGKRALNLFAFTCGFSLAAAKGGCEVVFSVDSALSALNLGKRNFEKNALTEKKIGKFVEEDVRAFLARQLRKVEKEGERAKFDLIVCDPPTFSSTQSGGAFYVEKEWFELAQTCSQLARKGALLYFSTNHRAGEKDHYEKALRHLFSKVIPLKSPFDFPEFQKEEQHVKLFLCEKYD
jgi:23S rRNA G2069 N7-methylase RlmK/C1962 C5-methylase RlmI